MNTRVYQTPIFDLLELDLAPEVFFNVQEKLQPITKGTPVSGLTTLRRVNKWHPYFDEIVLDTTSDQLRYTHKPLLLYFFEKDWGTIATNHLTQLNAVQQRLHDRQINLLVITSGSLKEFQKLSTEESYNLEPFEDSTFEIAGLLKIYSEKDPSWSRYPGIEGNIPLPALYLLDGARQIAFDFPNKAIDPELPLGQIWQLFDIDHNASINL